MAALISPVPDTDAALGLVEEALGWDLNGELPPVTDIMDSVEKITVYGRQVADHLEDERGQLCGVAVSGLRLSAQTVLGEASRRLYLPPPRVTQSAAAHRAQNSARIVKRLVEVTHEVCRAQRTAGQATQDDHTKGIR